MTPSIIKSKLTTITLLLPVILTAQQTINQDVRVVREYTPTISDATKMDQMPVLDDTSSYRPVFRYSILSRPIETPGKIDPISPARLNAERAPMVTNTRIKAGAGLNNSLMGEIDYNMPASKDYQFGLSLRQHSSWGKVTHENSREADAPLHETFVGANVKRFFTGTTLTSHIDYKRRGYEYYGMETFDTLQNYWIPNHNDPIKGNDLKVNSAQYTSQFSMGLGLNNRATASDDFQWNGNIDFSSFGNKTGVKQNQLDLAGHIYTPAGNLYFAADLDMNFYKVSTPDTIGPMYSFDDRQISLVKALPRLGYNFGNGYVEGGLLLISEMGRDDDEMRAAPHLYAQLDVAQGIVSLFGGMTGQLNRNDYATMQFSNPFISPDVNIQSSFYGMNLLGGIKGNFSSAASFSAKVEYSIFNDEHFFVNNSYERVSNGTRDYVNRFGVVYDDGSLLKLGGEMLITPLKMLSVKLSGNYYAWELDALANPYHKPNVDLGLGVNIKATDDLHISTNVTYVGQRKALLNTLIPVEKNLDAMVDINIGIRYDYTRSWSFWAQLDNLAARQYYQWYGYPSYKVHAMAGATFCF